MNQVQPLQFIVREKTKITIRIQPTPPPSLDLGALIAKLVGRPLYSCEIQAHPPGQRVAVMRVSPHLSYEERASIPFSPCMPTRRAITGTIALPVPIYNSMSAYTSEFVEAMQAWTGHLISWRSGHVAPDWWYKKGERLMSDVLWRANGLFLFSEEDSLAMKRVLQSSLSGLSGE